MQVITINNEKYNIPQSWNDITLKQQIEISEFVKRDDTFKNIHMISTYTGIPMELVKKMNISQFKQILNIMEFLQTEVKPIIVKSFDYNGHTYQVADSMLKGETQDFLSIEAMLKVYKDNQTKALPYILAITCKREGETLDSFDPEVRAKDFEGLSWELANNVWFFFAKTGHLLSIDIKRFLEVQDKQMEMSLHYTENLLKQQVGQGLFKRFRRMYLRLLINYTRRSWKNFLIIIQLKSSDKNLKPKFMKRMSNWLKLKVGNRP